MNPYRCLILAAGRGTRMRPVSTIIPKELLPIGSRSLLQWCITEALEGGFAEIGVITRFNKPLIEEYLTGGGWTEGLLESLRLAATNVHVHVFHQNELNGIVGAVLAAREWVEDGQAFAVFLPDNVRIAGPPALSAGHLDEATTSRKTIVACHRVGPESQQYYANVGRLVLEPLAPMGSRPRVLGLQDRGNGSFKAVPEGSWRLLPRWVVTEDWITAARQVSVRAAIEGREADDVQVHQRLVESGVLEAETWTGTMVDAGHPLGYLYAQHLLHDAAVRSREAEGDRSEPLLSISLMPRAES